MFAFLLDTVRELAGDCGAAALIALSLGWPVMAGPGWRWM